MASIYFVVFILGSLWGSFCNVCIYRLPIKGDVVSSRSRCRSCKKIIRWFDNIPLISYIILLAKCRNCKTKINFRYFAVELSTALSFLAVFYLYGVTISTLLLMVLIIFFVIIFFIDLDHYIIPNELTFPLMLIGFVKSFDPNINLNLFPNYLDSLIGGALGYILIWGLITLYLKIRNKEGMGLGDAKLLSAIGFWFGWISIPFVIFLSSVIALLSVIPSLLKKSKSMSSQIPFGPFIILGCILYIFFSEQYKNLLFG